MKPVYNPSKLKQREAESEPGAPPKIQINIRLDQEIIEYFEVVAERAGHKVKWQSLINAALREYIKSKTSK